MKDQELFDYLDQEFGIIALESEMDELKKICNKEIIEQITDDSFEFDDIIGLKKPNKLTKKEHDLIREYRCITRKQS